MKVTIRVDASNRIGLGHLIRCRTLATSLRERGAEVRFICRTHPGHGIETLEADAFRVAALPAPPIQTSKADDADYSCWLGVTQPMDARETLTALGEWRPDWLIIDHYGLDRDWERSLRPQVGRILVIDDLANRPHDCDLLLDQNHALDARARYRDLLPEHTPTLLGPSHALLRPEYAEYRRALPPRKGGVRRVLVFFGGTDPDNLTGRALAALSDPSLTALTVDLVIGANNPHRETLVDQAATRPRTRVHHSRPHLADLMVAANLFIGAGGTTTWERCCLGLPSLVVSIADNQRPACAALAAAGVIDYLGYLDRVTVSSLRDAILRLTSDADQLNALSKAGTALVDGNGVERVMQQLFQGT